MRNCTYIEIRFLYSHMSVSSQSRIYSHEIQTRFGNHYSSLFILSNRFCFLHIDKLAEDWAQC